MGKGTIVVAAAAGATVIACGTLTLTYKGVKKLVRILEEGIGNVNLTDFSEA